MEWRYQDQINALDAAVLSGDGKAAPELRRAVEAAAARTAGADRAESGAPAPAIEAYAERVAREAYRIEDADLERLLREGYGEDVIFEVTVAAALGAGLARLERGLVALRSPPA